MIVLYVIRFSLIILHIPDFWWTSPLCYAVGLLMSEYEEQIKTKINMRLSVVLCILTALLYIAACKFTLYIALPLCLLCSLTIIVFTGNFAFKSEIFEFIGKRSLEIYLCQLCLMNLIMNGLEWNINLKVSIFFSGSVIASMFVNKISEQLKI